MAQQYIRLTLTGDQRLRIQALCERNNYRGFVSIATDYLWIAAACFLSLGVHPLFYPVSVLVIGARQRALGSLFHDASHGTLFRSRRLSAGVSRVFCGWPILQSMQAYRWAHVIGHHSRMGDPVHDPDYKGLKDSGVYEAHRGPDFFRRFVLGALCGRLTIRYVKSLMLSRLAAASQTPKARVESGLILAFHASVAAVAYTQGWFTNLLLFWWVPLVVVYPVIGWFSELSEHYPLMASADERRFHSRNRYPSRIERLFVGMHSDSLHLTHHLLPAVPHWNLDAATQILREDRTFAQWDDAWGGIFSSDRRDRTTFIDFVRTPATV